MAVFFFRITILQRN